MAEWEHDLESQVDAYEFVVTAFDSQIHDRKRLPLRPLKKQQREKPADDFIARKDEGEEDMTPRLDSARQVLGAINASLVRGKQERVSTDIGYGDRNRPESPTKRSFANL
jgi:hypothetical protein